MRSRRVTLLLMILLALTLGSRAPSTQAGIAIPEEVAAQVAADGSALVIVGVRAAWTPEGDLPGADAVTAQREAMYAAVDAAMGRAAAAGAVLGARFDTIPFFTARVDAGALAALASSPEIASIELDGLKEPMLGQSIPLMNVPPAWSAGHTGAGWQVAVLDTGVDKTHPFFGNKVVSEACYSNANGAGVGISTCPGGVGSSTAPNSGLPCNLSVSGCDHGTHVAGIAAGVNGPGGINGVAPGANLIAVQVFTIFTTTSVCGGAPPCIAAYTSDIVRGLERVQALAGAANVNQVASANMSLGGGGPSTNCDASNATTKTAIDNLRSIGIASVIASGNNGFTTGISAPACISTAVSVGSTTKTPESVSSFTNRGGGKPDIMATGSSITSSIPGGVFGIKSGTSMATPHVAGAWAIFKQAVPGASVSQALSALQSTGVPINDPLSLADLSVPQAIYPRMNVDAARLALIGGGGGGAPGAPGAPTISGSGNNITISWTAPTTGGAPTNYNLIARLTPGGAILANIPVGNVLSVNIPGAPNGTFVVSVQASNASGTGPESPGTTFTVPLVPPAPGAPTNLAASVLSPGNAAQFTWTPPTTGGTATGYALAATLTPGGAPLVLLPFPAPANVLNVTGIPPGTFYIKLAATNAGGMGPFSNEVPLVIAPPNAPTLNAPGVVGNTVNLSWTPGAGPPTTSFILTAALTPSGAPIVSVPLTGTSISIPGVPSGTFYLRIHGVNAVGTGPASNQVTLVVP